MISRRSILSASLLAGLVLPVLSAGDEKLPSADKILDRYIEATGGKDAHARLKSAVITMTMVMPAQGVKAVVTSYIVDPDKRYQVTEIPGAGLFEEGAIGGVAWSKNAMMGTRLKDGEEKDMAIRSSALDKDLKWRTYYSKVETVGVENINGKDCYKVSLTPTVGSTETRYYDKASGLIARLSVTSKTPMGEIPTEIDFDDFKMMDGINSPTKMATRAAGQEMQMTIDSIKYNTAIPDEKFKLPSDVQDLVNKKNGGAPASPKK